MRSETLIRRSVFSLFFAQLEGGIPAGYDLHVYSHLSHSGREANGPSMAADVGTS